MKIGRNETCPCGSGKKYKHCCLNIKDDIDKKEFNNDLYNLVFGIRNLVLRNVPHIKEYKKIRNIHSEVLDSMIDYIDNKYPFRGTIEKQIHIFENEIDVKLDLYKEDDTRVYYDLLIYPNDLEITSITEMYLNQKKFRKEEKIIMLNAMKESYVGFFKIISKDYENSYVEIEDIFTKKKFKIIDIALATLTKENVYLYNRVITYNDISFLSGINLSFTFDNPIIKSYIKKYDSTNTNHIEKTLKLFKIYNKSDFTHKINVIK
ncbi:MAG: SEC-C domain-containing protein [Bacilli bacterium]|nr:SEC-C domain-containing protein [Bacilli bacterium]